MYSPFALQKSAPVHRATAGAGALAAALLTLLSPAGPALAQGEPALTVQPVPFSTARPDLPHPGHELAPVTLKAILRGATCPSGYQIRWDVDRNGRFRLRHCPFYRRRFHHFAKLELAKCASATETPSKSQSSPRWKRLGDGGCDWWLGAALGADPKPRATEP